MGYDIIRFDEPLPEKSLLAVIFGQPGTGKTSLSFTTEEPCLLDFDEGLERAVNRKTAVKFKTWQDANNFLDSEDFKEMNCKTLIADTGGTMLDDYIAQYVIKQDPKNARGGGDLSLQGYGAMKNAFGQFRSKTKALGMDVIIVCHTKSVDDGGSQKHVPKLTGGAYDILMAKADLVGYTSMKGNKITVDFNPTDSHTGKNCAQIPIQEVPHYDKVEYSTFMGDLIQKTKDFMTRQSEAQVKAVEEVQELRDQILLIKDVEALEEYKPEMNGLSKMYQAQVKQTWDEHFIKLWPVTHLADVKKPADFELVTELLHGMPKYNSAKLRPVVRDHMEKCGVMYDTVEKVFILTPDHLKAESEPSATAEEESSSEATEKPKETSKEKAKPKAKKNTDTVTSKEGEKVTGKTKMEL